MKSAFLLVAVAAATDPTSIVFKATNGGNDCTMKYLNNGALALDGCKLQASGVDIDPHANSQLKTDIKTLKDKVAEMQNNLEHPCDTAPVLHKCDQANGVCGKSVFATVGGVKTHKGSIHNVATYHCGCKRGYMWVNPGNTNDLRCIATPSPTPYPTSYPTPNPTNYPT